MKAEKDKKTGKWLIQYRYTDWQGKRRKSTKRGFATKREAEEWLRNFLITQKADFDMKFENFWKMYCADMETRLREHTIRTKKYIVELKILLYFGNKRVNDITAADIRQWQNELIKMGYSPTYLKTINNQLSAIFNYAVRYYDLKSNPCAKAGSMGKSKAEEMDFWTGEEFRKFIDSVMNKRLSYMAFMTLYWTGMRLGELLALNPKDVDLEKRTITITKSYQRLGKKDVITPPKTPKSKRVITIPEFLAADIKDYIDSSYELQENDRLFPITKYYLEHEMQRGIKESGVKRIRVHDLRHYHVSLLISMGFSAVSIGNRVGHESVDITYRYAHMFPTEQTQMAKLLDEEFKEGAEE
ncbi:site-specific integrase [Coprococcus catus]|uniref:Site-specific integrase n=2 Tax=Coprococcus catus TaxID=116085 RepID=A0A3E2TAQ7_9FIRM|nr:site-specific integrase [Coprococcus catus]RGB71781.1 site-specific integrase [Coprococcus catus]CBK81672.1 Site-specific recombinase XerD [Coprococcus catus GD/7]